MKKTKYNPSGRRVLTKSVGKKGNFIKNLEQNRKRLGKNLLKGSK